MIICLALPTKHLQEILEIVDNQFELPLKQDFCVSLLNFKVSLSVDEKFRENCDFA